MLRDLEAIAVILNLTAVAVGFMWRRHRQQRRSANLEHIRNLELENQEIDETLDRLRRKS